MNYVIFDDLQWKNFLPVTYTRSIGDLRVGILKLRQRLNSYLEIDQNSVIISELLQELYKTRHPDWTVNTLRKGETCLVNSRLKINDELVKRIGKLESGTCLIYKETILAAKIDLESREINSEEIETLFSDLNKIEIEQDQLWNNIWDLITENTMYIERDFQDFFYEKDNHYDTELGITVLNPYNVWIGVDTEIKPGVVIDATEGPVIIDEEVKILPNAVITGPVFIGKKSIIKSGARILEGTSIGPVCKIGGEVEGSIIQAYSNKQHDGFLGHSYLGEWINLGANTSNSDLKNNYGTVKVYYYPKKEKIDTRSQFIGTVIADHVKTGINSTINSGSVIGVGCNLFGKDTITDFIPSFRWGSGADQKEYRIDRFLDTAEVVKSRRGISLPDVEKELFEAIKVLEQKII